MDYLDPEQDIENMTLKRFLEINLGPKHLPLSTVVPLTIILVLIFIAGVVGNICVCLVIVRHPSMHTATNYFLFSLAVSDLTLLILGLPNDLSVYWQQYPWVLGVGLCKFRAFVSEMGSYTSVLTIVAFSMERYLAICHPLHQYTMSGLQRALRIIVILWLISLAGAAPFAAFTTVNYLDFPPGSNNSVPESGFCAMLQTNIPKNWPIYELSCIVFFLLPMIVMLLLYLRMGIRIHNKTNRKSLTSSMEGTRHDHRNASKKTIFRMLAAVVVAFFLCWAPFHAQRLIYVHAKDWTHFQEINELMYHIAGCFYYFSTTVNPILYNVMSAKYRMAFREALCGSFCPTPTMLSRQRSSTTTSGLRMSATLRMENSHLLNKEKTTEVIVITDSTTKHWPKVILKAVNDKTAAIE